MEKEGLWGTPCNQISYDSSGRGRYAGRQVVRRKGIGEYIWGEDTRDAKG